MIQEFQVQNFYSIRERQSISFVPTNDDNMRGQYVHEVADGVGLLKVILLRYFSRLYKSFLISYSIGI